MSGIPYVGEIFALAAPVCWSVAVILFRKTGLLVPPLALNLFKNSLAVVLFLATLLVTGQQVFQDVPGDRYVLLLVSGAIGIGVSDTLFFMTLNRVGAGLQAIINTSYSPSIILLSFFWLGERLSLPQVLGVGLILGAVLSVSWMGGHRTELPRGRLVAGVVLGILTTSTQAVSIVMIKPVLGEMNLVWANFWRLVGGLGTSVLLVLVFTEQRHTLGALRNVRAWRVMIPGSIMGTYVSLLFWLGGMKYTQASIAAALNQTATLWTFLLAVLLLNEPATRARLAGLAVGLFGVALVTFG